MLSERVWRKRVLVKPKEELKVKFLEDLYYALGYYYRNV